MKTSMLAISLVAVTALGVYAYPTVSAKLIKPTVTPVAVAQPEVQTPEVQPSVVQTTVETAQGAATSINQKKIEVVFVLDTTGSMSGLIQGAKDNIWSIASSMASAESSPTIKMGLVAYRDRGDDYVTQVVDLNEDLDTNYGKLLSFQAAGGGDGPESVNKGLYDAVNGMSWSQDKDTYRVVFLVGDAPPHMDYQDEMQFPEIVKLANSKGIIVNAIQCGNDGSATSFWKQIAQLGKGEFFQVEQNGGAVAVSTPYDEQIATLSRELDGTRLYYGDKSVKEEKRQKRAATELFNRSASSSSIARKAEFNTSKSGKHNFVGKNELVDAISSGDVSLESITQDELPEELQSLGRDEQDKVIKEKALKREELKSKIAELSKKRGDYVKAELEKNDEAEESLDMKIYRAVKSQASEKGLIYSDDAPKY